MDRSCVYCWYVCFFTELLKSSKGGVLINRTNKRCKLTTARLLLLNPKGACTSNDSWTEWMGFITHSGISLSFLSLLGYMIMNIVRLLRPPILWHYWFHISLNLCSSLMDLLKGITISSTLIGRIKSAWKIWSVKLGLEIVTGTQMWLQSDLFGPAVDY